MTHPLVAELTRDLVVCEGPDTVTFLHSQLSQDVVGMAVGETRWSFLLQPQGKPVALLRVTRLADDRVLLDTDPGFGEPVRAALERFKIRTKMTLALQQGVRTLAWRDTATDAPVAGGAYTVPFTWGGWTGVDVMGPTGAVVTTVDPEAYDAARIQHGVPVNGREVTGEIIPAESGAVPAAASFTKGCYVGQELVERIDSRGSRVPRLLRLVRVPVAAGVPSQGDELLGADGRVLGTITSAAPDPDGGAVVALAFVRREVEPPAELLLGGAPVTVHELPPASA